MNKPITLCDRCKENARCCLNYDGDNCRGIRTVEPTNADRIRAMTDDELAEFLELDRDCYRCILKCQGHDGRPVSRGSCKLKVLDWLRQEAEG